MRGTHRIGRTAADHLLDKSSQVELTRYGVQLLPLFSGDLDCTLVPDNDLLSLAAVVADAAITAPNRASELMLRRTAAAIAGTFDGDHNDAPRRRNSGFDTARVWG